MKHFIVSDGKKIVKKVLKGLELADENDNKLTLVKLKFSMNSYKNLAENETKKLSEAAQDLLHLRNSFGKKWKHYKLSERVYAWRSHTKTNNCDLWALLIAFLWKPFFPDENSKLHSHKRLTNTAPETLLKEYFIWNPENNEQPINES